jgi:hypothetical protein
MNGFVTETLLMLEEEAVELKNGRRKERIIWQKDKRVRVTGCP